jgi:PAS domain S-box-containing protein
VADARFDPRLVEARRGLAEYGIEALVLAPLAVRERFIGILEIHQCDRSRHWREAELGLSESVTKQVATAIHQNRLYARLRETVRETEALYRAAAILVDTSDLNALLAQILDAVADEFGHPRGAILLVDDTGEKLTVAALKDHPTGALHDFLLVDGPGIAPFVVRTQETINIPDVNEDSRYVQQWRECRSELAVPLVVDGLAMGVLDLQSSEPNAFSDRDRRVLMSFAERASSAIKQARLFQLVRRGKREWEASVDAMPDAVFIFNRAGNVRRVNTAAAKLAGRSFQELLGVRCCAIFCGDDEGCLVERAIKSSERGTATWRRDGRSIAMTVDPIRSEEGESIGAVVVASSEVVGSQ